MAEAAVHGQQVGMAHAHHGFCLLHEECLQIACMRIELDNTCSVNCKIAASQEQSKGRMLLKRSAVIQGACSSKPN